MKHSGAGFGRTLRFLHGMGLVLASQVCGAGSVTSSAACLIFVAVKVS